jgi:signal recognition particle subunit SRP68
VKDDLNGLDKAVSAVLGQRTIERNQLLVSMAKSKLTRRHDKNEKVTKPEELVRLQVNYLYLFVFDKAFFI